MLGMCFVMVLLYVVELFVWVCWFGMVCWDFCVGPLLVDKFAVKKWLVDFPFERLLGSG